MYGLLEADTQSALGATPDETISAEGGPPGFKILEPLGAGGMGVVYKAFQKDLSRIVALKVVRDANFVHPQQIARFRAEAESVARLQHPNIVQVFGVGEFGHRPYIVLEYIEGGNLGERLGGRPQPPRDVALIIETIARAVHYAHQRGIVHRDLKPANVLLQPTDKLRGSENVGNTTSPDVSAGPEVATDLERRPAVRWCDATPKITDFGIAKRLDVHAGMTRTGDLIGTPSYMAPEQAGGDSTAHCSLDGRLFTWRDSLRNAYGPTAVFCADLGRDA